jgi:hypothetical protein
MSVQPEKYVAVVEKCPNLVKTNLTVSSFHYLKKLKWRHITRMSVPMAHPKRRFLYFIFIIEDLLYSLTFSDDPGIKEFANLVKICQRG